MQKVLVFIVTYNAEKTIQQVLARIPEKIFNDKRYTTDILIIDDSSKDNTFFIGHDSKKSWSKSNLTILKNPKNLGYGGNQKLGYKYAIDNNYDVVVLLHGDGQYAPEAMPVLLEPLINKEAGAVFGSRMINKADALKGGMPMYKFVGNQILTRLENLLVGTNLSEYHSGYRLYSVESLKKIPFERNSNGFDFDTDIIIQLHASKSKIVEIPIPTFYGDEICHVNGISYALTIVKTCIKYRMQQLRLFYDPRFDISNDSDFYKSKFHFLSSHSLGLSACETDDSVLILGCGPYQTVKPFFEKSKSIFTADFHIDDLTRKSSSNSIEVNLDTLTQSDLPKNKMNKVIVLDIIEHLKSPETFLETLRECRSLSEATFIFTTPNIAFAPVRLMLLLGMFNYGKSGILDKTHTRLFTLSSFRRMLEMWGFEVTKQRGIPAPFPLALGDNRISRYLLRLNDMLIKLLPGIFSFQLYFEAQATPTVPYLLEQAFVNSAHEEKRYGIS